MEQDTSGHEDVFERAMRLAGEYFTKRDVPFDSYHAFVNTSRMHGDGCLATVDGTATFGAGDFAVQSEVSCDVYDSGAVVVVGSRSADCPWGVGGSFGELKVLQ